jgi:signal transduction histidine kinase
MRRLAARFQHDIKATITLYDNKNILLASNVKPPLPPLKSEQHARLMHENGILFHAVPKCITVGIIENNSLKAYGHFIIQGHRHPPPPLRHILAFPFMFFFLCLAVTSIVFARHLAKPITRLIKATQEFGNGNLEARVNLKRRDEFGDLARSFDEMANKINLLLKAQKELLANIAHELRTPLARIHVALDIVDLEKSSNEEKEEIADIVEDLKELEKLVDEIILMARLDLEENKMNGLAQPLHIMSVNPRSIIEPVIERFRKNESGHRLKVIMEEKLSTIEADCVLLRRVINNLLDNARKYSDAASTITLKLYEDSNNLICEVIDEGMGIDEEHLDHVFKPFFRIDSSRTRATGGVGLGLTLSQRIIEAHGGSISINSKKGHGTVVQFSIPIAVAT